MRALLRLLGQNCTFVKFGLSYLDTKKRMLEYWYIEHGLFSQFICKCLKSAKYDWPRWVISFGFVCVSNVLGVKITKMFSQDSHDEVLLIFLSIYHIVLIKFVLYFFVVTFPTRWKQKPNIITNYFVAAILEMALYFFQLVKVCVHKQGLNIFSWLRYPPLLFFLVISFTGNIQSV